MSDNWQDAIIEQNTNEFYVNNDIAIRIYLYLCFHKTKNAWNR